MGNNVDELGPYPQALADAVFCVFEQWLVQRVSDIARSSACNFGGDEQRHVRDAAREATAHLRETLLELLRTDVDEQRKGPLQVIREAATLMNSVLRVLRVPETSRDEFDARSLPEDVYGIGPLAWRDLGDAVHDAGIEWGAWKAATVLQRRRNEGKLD